MGENVVKIIENFLELLKRHENKIIGQFRSKNEIHELFPPEWTLEFLFQSIGKSTLDRLLIACRSFL